MNGWVILLLGVLLIAGLIGGILYWNYHSLQKVQKGDCVSISTGRGNVITAKVVEKGQDFTIVKISNDPGLTNIMTVDQTRCNEIP